MMMQSPKTVLRGLTLHVEDVERSRQYYERIPGAVLELHRPREFALLRIGDAQLGLLASAVLPEGSPRFHIEISTSQTGVDALYERVLDAGIEPDGPPADRGWGERTFHATDPDGNLVEFDSRLDDA